jgi:pSer/pThr/pTyr-binding forkhead associated (FHA) protein
MSSNRVILKATAGPAQGVSQVFDAPRQCLIGRAPDCDVQLSGLFFANVSRHHCELDIDPPHVRVRDLGSRNDTLLNGKPIGQGNPYLETDTSRSPGDFVPLKDGDELRIGDSTFQIRILPTANSNHSRGRFAWAAEATAPVAQ